MEEESKRTSNRERGGAGSGTLGGGGGGGGGGSGGWLAGGWLTWVPLSQYNIPRSIQFFRLYDPRLLIAAGEKWQVGPREPRV